MSDTASVNSAVQLSRRTAELLDAAVGSNIDSRDALADRLLGEALRVERHPLIRFVAGAGGRREPTVAGTRLKVRDIVSTFTGEGGDVNATAAYFDVPRRMVVAALDYHAAHTAEMDADRAWADEIARAHRQRWDERNDVG